MPTRKYHRARRLFLVLGFAAATLVVLLLLGAGAFVVWLRNADLTPLAAREATAALGRQVTIGQLDITWADPLGIVITDLAVANAEWGSRKDMIRIGRFAALLDAGALWRGQLRYERLRILDADIVLERDKDGTGNWKFPGDSGGGGFAIVPKDRTQFPTLIDFAGEHGHITYRTRSGNILDIALDQVAIAAPDETAPVRLQATGAYNDVALDLAATTESFAALRDAARPFGMDFTVTGKDTAIAFQGTSMEPLDFEGMRGALQLKAKTLNDILAAMRAKAQIDLPLDVAGSFTRDGDHWALTQAKGKLARTAFTGDLALSEGGPGEADDVALDLDFAPLDLDPLLAAAGLGGKAAKAGAATAGWEKAALYPDFLRALKLSADLKTPLLSFGATKLPDFALQGRADGGKVALKALRFGFAGGTLAFSGEADGREKSPALRLQANLAKADIAALAALLGGGKEIRGRLDGAATLALRGATLGEALAHGDGALLLTLAQGDVAQSLIEQVSADLRSIFRDKAGRVQVGCLLAVATVKDGIGTLAPLRLESDAAILRGAGTIDLRQRRLDLTIQTERDSTNFFALDLPIRVSGPFANLTAKPQLGDDAGVPETAGAGALAKLPAALRQLARGNDCVE